MLGLGLDTVLKGSLGAAESIFERIHCDPRHHDVSILHFKPSEARGFASWSMACSGLSAPAGLGGLPDRSPCEAGQDLVTVLTERIALYEAP